MCKKAGRKKIVLLIEPGGGLCNRLICINNLIHLSEKLPEIQIDIVWWKEPECGCRYEDILKKIPGIEVKNFSRPVKGKMEYMTEKKYLHVIISVFQAAFFRLYYRGTQKYRINGFDSKEIVLTEEDMIRRIETFKPGRTVYHRMGSEYRTPCVLSEKMFADEVVKKADSIKELFCGERYIGLHIRRTDHKKAIQNSPLEFFEEAVKREKKVKENTLFYLATDEQSVIDRLLKLYGDSIIVNKEGEKGRISSGAIQDAAADLLVLSGADKIYGSVGSTFSEMAAQIGKIPLILKLDEG